jgi:RNA polymerase sigma factor (sigma-70 family)
MRRRVWNVESAAGAREGNHPREEHSTDDDDAVARARAGDLAAYGVLVARYTAAAHRTACLLGPGDDADDVVQEAFVKGFRGLVSFRVGASFRPWLLQIVANETRNLSRSMRRRAALERRVAAVLPDAVDRHGPETQAMAGAGAAALLAAVRALPDKDRLVVTGRPPVCRSHPG